MNAHRLPAQSLFILAVLLAATIGLGTGCSHLDTLAKAKTRAASEKKAIYVHFGASWCSWCRKHDAFLESAEVKAVFEKYFVPVKVVVQESDEHKSENTPGGAALLVRSGGTDEGLPFLAFFDANGKLIINSKAPGEAGKPNSNIGHPSAPAEIAWFSKMMKTAAPTMSTQDVSTIEEALRKSAASTNASRAAAK